MKRFEVKISTKYPVVGEMPDYIEIEAKNKTEAIKLVREKMNREMVFDRYNPGVYSVKEI